jgi:hypothetical protein
MRVAGRPRQSAPPPNAAQLSLFPGLPPAIAIQPAIRLTETNVARTVPPGRPGVFFLKSVSADGRVAERVGRDDVDLRQRLLQYAREKPPNVLFGWILAEDANQAYQLEATLARHGGAWAGRIAQTLSTDPFPGCPTATSKMVAFGSQ